MVDTRLHSTASTSSSSRRSEGDESELIDPGRRNWHAGLPPAPTDLSERATFALTRHEAEYLRERYITSSGASMLAWALQHPAKLDHVNAPWEHPRIDDAPPPLRRLVEVGRRFSLLMYGATLVYNAALAELSAGRNLRDDALAHEYHDAYAVWVEQRIRPELDALRVWERAELWTAVDEMLRGRVARTRDFAERWMAAVLADPTRAFDDPAVRSLIASRERAMKGQLARLHNDRALERWGGRSGVYELTYRWGQGRTVLSDIAAGLRSGGGD